MDAEVVRRWHHRFLAFASHEDTPGLLAVAVLVGLGVGAALLWFLWPAGVLLLLISTVPVALLVTVLRARRKLSTQVLARSILAELKRTGVRRFRLSDVDGIADAPALVRAAATADVYALYYGAATKDAKITPPEREELNALAGGLGLSVESRRRIEQWRGQAVYSQALAAVLSDGMVSSTEASLLKSVRAQLSLSDEHAVSATMPQVRDAYLALFRRLADDGTLTDDELAQLGRFREATGLSLQQAASITAVDAMSLFSRAVSMSCQDLGIRPSDRAKLTALGEALAVPAAGVEVSLWQFDRALMLAEIHRGRLPAIQAPILLRSTEICRYWGACSHIYNTRTRTISVKGHIAVSDTRLVFEGQRSFEFRIKRIINIRAFSNAVDLMVSSGRGQGRYYVEDGILLAAILAALVHAHNRCGFESLDEVRSRRIPDEVKVAVWRRDGGRCARCGAQDYLEFDHIIPYSKGGANTAKNIQLLCRRCNQAKGDELI